MTRHLVPGNLDTDPLAQFRAWFVEAQKEDIELPEAVVLATATRSGRPSARVVLLKRVDTGFVFHTNYESRKGRELETNAAAALAVHWQPLGRQVRVEGPVTRVTAEETATYFATRPRGAQIGAWASPQSSPIADRAELEARLEEVRAEYAGRELPPPPWWGGYRLVPDRVEFWQHGDDRLHDRLVYERDGEGWLVTRLAP